MSGVLHGASAAEGVMTVVPVQIDRFRIHRTIVWVCLGDNLAITGSTGRGAVLDASEAGALLGARQVQSYRGCNVQEEAVRGVAEDVYVPRASWGDVFGGVSGASRQAHATRGRARRWRSRCRQVLPRRPPPHPAVFLRAPHAPAGDFAASVSHMHRSRWAIALSCWGRHLDIL